MSEVIPPCLSLSRVIPSSWRWHLQIQTFLYSYASYEGNISMFLHTLRHTLVMMVTSPNSNIPGGRQAFIMKVMHTCSNKPGSSLCMHVQMHLVCSPLLWKSYVLKYTRKQIFLIMKAIPPRNTNLEADFRYENDSLTYCTIQLRVTRLTKLVCIYVKIDQYHE